MLKMCHKLLEPLDYWRYSFISFIIYPFVPFFFPLSGVCLLTYLFLELTDSKETAQMKMLRNRGFCERPSKLQKFSCKRCYVAEKPL